MMRVVKGVRSDIASRIEELLVASRKPSRSDDPRRRQEVVESCGPEVRPAAGREYIHCMARRVMAVTMGDASGVGPEIAVRRFAEGRLGGDVVVYGDAAVLARAARELEVRAPLHCVEAPEEAVEGRLNVRDLRLLDAEQVTPGVLDTAAGAAAIACVEHAVRDALAGRVAGVVTLPLNKEAARRSRPDFVGHTEFIAGLCGVGDVSMMLMLPELAVTHVSAHVSLREAIERVEPVRIRKVIDLTHAALSRFVERPRIAVCGLNPHAGENRLFGDEDEDIIRPTIERAAADGLDVSGPHPADTVFRQAIRLDRHDAVVCMYHDQGHAPMKLHGFERGVNVTIGLPIVRTSVDHGTAFDIAWQGKAFTDSLGHALDCSWRLAGRP